MATLIQGTNFSGNAILDALLTTGGQPAQTQQWLPGTINYYELNGASSGNDASFIQGVNAFLALTPGFALPANTGPQLQNSLAQIFMNFEEFTSDLSFNAVNTVEDGDFLSFATPTIAPSTFFGPMPEGRNFNAVATAGNDLNFTAINSSVPSFNIPAELGGSNELFLTVIHETGHALGFGNTIDGGSTQSFPTTLNSTQYTALSVLGSPLATTSDAFGRPTGFMALDIAAFQHLYGLGSNNVGDTVYNLTDAGTIALDLDGSDGQVSIGRAFSTIWDANVDIFGPPIATAPTLFGGNDTISYQGANNDAWINLNDATLNLSDTSDFAYLQLQSDIVNSSIWSNLSQILQREIDGTVTGAADSGAFHAGGFFSYLVSDIDAGATPEAGGYSIANGVIIENAIGGNRDDVLIGNEFNNTLTGNGGNDFLFGGAGNDDLIGGDGDDFLFGGAGNDRLDGRTGEFFSDTDTLDGGTGFNVFINGVFDIVIDDLADGFANDFVDRFSFGRIQSPDGSYQINWLGLLPPNWDSIESQPFSITDPDFDALDQPRNEGLSQVVHNGIISFAVNELSDLEITTPETISTIVDFNFGDGEIYLDSGREDVSILGTNGEDVLIGTSADDLIVGADGNDDLSGGAGNDEISGEGDDDHISGGSGADELYGDRGDDLVDGGEDNDTLFGGAGDDALVGGSGDDLLSGGVNSDNLVGGTGSDTLIGGAGNDVITTDAEDGSNNRNDQDVVVLGDVLARSSGNDIITDFDTDNFRGGENNFDTLSFTFNGEDFNLSEGRDFVNFVDTIESDGDTETDAIRDGNDLIFVFARDENGLITDSVTLEGVIGDDGITNNRLNNASVDELTDGDIFANFGDFEDNVLSGSDNFDALFGEGGDDTLVGGLGSDTLEGGAGDDILTGDAADGSNDRNDQDVFVYGDVDTGAIGNDVITDFDTNNFDGGENNFDTLELSIGGVAQELSTGQDILDFAELLNTDASDDTGAFSDGGDVVLVFQRDALGEVTDSIRLQDVIGDDGITNDALDDALVDTFETELQIAV